MNQNPALLPLRTPRVLLTEAHSDARGTIQELISLERGCDVQVITSKAGAVRGNHRHRGGWHFTYLVQGSMRYTEELGATARQVTIVQTGEMVYSLPGVGHAMEFLLDTVMVVIGDRRRDQDEYESDLERVAVV